MRPENRNIKGFTIVELIITLVIASLLVTIAVVTIVGVMPTYKLSRGTRQVFNAMLSGRSKAVSLNKTYRLVVLDSTRFKLQWDDSGTWTDDGAVQTLPSDIEISQSPIDYVTKCGSNLEFTSRGIFEIGTADTDPFIVLENTSTNEEKSISVNIGGNITINR